MRQYAQRLHIMHSLNRLLYHLFVLSFLSSPSLLQLLARVIAQFQILRPREIDPERSLRFWVIILFCANVSSLFTHAVYRTSESTIYRGIVLDFIGTANLTSRTQLLMLDFLIIFFQFAVLCISYETSLANALQSAQDPLVPVIQIADDDTSSPKTDIQQLVLHLRFRPTMRRIRDPPPVIPRQSSDLPLPNTTRALSAGRIPLRLLFPALFFHRRAPTTTESNPRPESDHADNEPTTPVPGSFDTS